MRHTVCRTQLGYKGLPPFLKLLVRLADLHSTPYRLRLRLCRFSVERESKGKIDVKPFHRCHRLQAQQSPGEVNTVPGRATGPAAEPASPEGHGRMLIPVEWTHRPALAVEGQPIVSGSVLGAHSLPAIPENISHVHAALPPWELVTLWVASFCPPACVRIHSANSSREISRRRPIFNAAGKSSRFSSSEDFCQGGFKKSPQSSKNADWGKILYGRFVRKAIEKRFVNRLLG